MYATPQRFALVIGAMKSGTTTLFDLLAQHPEIAAARVKEPDFFVQHADPAAAWPSYLSLWHWNGAQHRVALEASVAYTKFPIVRDVPQRISTVTDVEFRFIYVLRNPLRRIESQVRHAIFEGWGKSLDDGGLTSDLLDFSRYAMQLREYRKYFEREEMLVLLLDDLEQSPAAVLRACCRFLGVSEDFDFENPHERKNSGDLYTVPSTVKAVVKNDLLRAVAQAVLPRRMYQAIRERIGKELGGRASIGRWRLNEAEERRVIDQLLPDLQLLKHEFGIDATTAWNISLEPQEP